MQNRNQLVSEPHFELAARPRQYPFIVKSQPEPAADALQTSRTFQIPD
jgi:hypothetical protein